MNNYYTNKYKSINQRLPEDASGEGWDKFADTMPTITTGQHYAKAFAQGLASGSKQKAAALRQRQMQAMQDKMDEDYDEDRARKHRLEDANLKLARINAELQTKIGNNRIQEETYKQIASDNIYDIQRLNEIMPNNDEQSVKEKEYLVNRLFSQLGQVNPDMVENTNFSHIKGNMVYFENNDGDGFGKNIKDLASNFIRFLPDEYKKELKNLQLSSVAKQFEDEEKIRDLTIQEKQANITSKGYDDMLKKSQADLYKQKALLEEFKVEHPDVADPKTKRMALAQNHKFMEMKNKKLFHDNNYEARLRTLDVFEELLNSSTKTGTSLFQQLNRIYSHYTGNNKDIQLMQLYQNEFISAYKAVGGSNPNQKEFQFVTDRLVGPEVDPRAALERIKSIRYETNRELDNYHAYQQAFDKFPSSVIYYDPKIEADVRKCMENAEKQREQYNGTVEQNKQDDGHNHLVEKYLRNLNDMPV